MRARIAVAVLLACASLGAAAVEAEETAKAILERANDFRKEHELQPLSVSRPLEEAARGFARYMAKSGKFGHAADGRQPPKRAAAQDYDYCIVAENIGFQYRSTGYD